MGESLLAASISSAALDSYDESQQSTEIHGRLTESQELHLLVISTRLISDDLGADSADTSELCLLVVSAALMKNDIGTDSVGTGELRLLVVRTVFVGDHLRADDVDEATPHGHLSGEASTVIDFPSKPIAAVTLFMSGRLLAGRSR